MAARVQPPMMEREIVDMFTGTLQGQCYTIYGTSSSFAEMVTYGERIEVGIKLGKIQDVFVINAGNAKKHFGDFQKKKETEPSALYTRKGKGKTYQGSDPQIAAITIPVIAPQQQAYVPRQGNHQNLRPPLGSLMRFTCHMLSCYLSCLS